MVCVLSNTQPTRGVSHHETTRALPQVTGSARCWICLCRDSKRFSTRCLTWARAMPAAESIQLDMEVTLHAELSGLSGQAALKEFPKNVYLFTILRYSF